ncbi:hypothetical protein QCE62_19840 [Caballeronia sp. LZ033]|uniref:hypothetical protein n=1 Tax=Caballeronia sp. LZ033 TaxID=3038566 RepID=UPI0028640849|nr:hypothetical protein [Caballeronia sp. LZ033]MDR5815843.1 hypothetical protein [Caballeronia sp. LZ033]
MTEDQIEQHAYKHSCDDDEPLFSFSRRDLFAFARALLSSALATEGGEAKPFQARVQPWLMECFGKKIAGDREERNHRFFEEAGELVQACGMSASEAHQLVEYVWNRQVGEKHQEVGGVMVTLAALCLANGLDMHAAGETELARIWTKVEAIRAKQAAKPKHSPLPVAGAVPHSQGKKAAASEDPGAPLRMPLLAEDHKGMRVDYSGMFKWAASALARGSSEPALAEMLRQLKEHISELGKRWYGGDTAVVDELLQLYCVERGAREVLVNATRETHDGAAE